MFAISRSACDGKIRCIDAGFVARFALEGFAQQTGAFGNIVAIHHEKRLWSSIGAGAAFAWGRRIAEIEQREEAGHSGSAERQVDRAADAEHRFLIGADVGAGFAPVDALAWIGHAAHGHVEFAGIEEQRVADLFEIETAAIGAGEQAIGCVDFMRLRRGLAAHLIGAGEQQHPVHCFERPACLNEPAGEEIEQFGMRGKLAGAAVIVGSADDALGEVILPDAVRDYAGGERMGRRGEPLGHFETSGALLDGRLIFTGYDLQELPGHYRAFARYVAAD